MTISRADTITVCSQGCDHSSVIAHEGGNALSTWCPDCRADIDCQDGVVDTGDLGFLLASWHSSDPPCDLNADGLVDGLDLGMLFVEWGPCR